MAPRCDSPYCPILIQVLSMAISIFCCIFSGFNLFKWFHPARLAVNVYVFIFGLVAFIADIRCFNVFGYFKFIYTPFGRGLFFIFIGCLMLSDGIFSLISGSVMIAMGLLYFIMAQIFGGVPRPLCQRNVEDLPLNTELRFVDAPEIRSHITSRGHYGSQPLGGSRTSPQGFRI